MLKTDAVVHSAASDAVVAGRECYDIQQPDVRDAFPVGVLIPQGS